MPSQFEFHTQQLSNRQYCLLHECVSEGGLTLERVLQISQTTSGSIVRRGFIRWDAGIERFTLTSAGLSLMEHFQHTDIGRFSIDRPLSTFILKHNKRLEEVSRAQIAANHQTMQQVRKLKEQRDEAMKKAQLKTVPAKRKAKEDRQTGKAAAQQ